MLLKLNGWGWCSEAQFTSLSSIEDIEDKVATEWPTGCRADVEYPAASRGGRSRVDSIGNKQGSRFGNAAFVLLPANFGTTRHTPEQAYLVQYCLNL